MKGPVLEIKKRSSKQLPVIECSEFRTSKLCLDCGREAKLFNYGVTYCQERANHRMANRDVVAAKKIGARYLAEKKGLNLGPWSRGVSVEEVERGTYASPVLKRVLTSYESGTFTFWRFPIHHSQRARLRHTYFSTTAISGTMMEQRLLHPRDG